MKAQKTTSMLKTRHTMRRIAFPVHTAYLWVLMTLFGAVVLETFMVYPNVFADPPESLDAAMAFLAVAGPDDFFPVSILYFWPRNTIMFTEGTAVHSAEYLRHVADEFVRWHSASRLLFTAGAAVAAFVAFLKSYRYWMISRGSGK